MKKIYIVYLISFLIIVFLAYFTRKPERINTIEDKNIPVSPCDGTVMNVDKNEISVFLSVLDVHWQYVPIKSKIKSIETIHGKHKMAFKPVSEHNAGVKVIFSSEIGDIEVTQRVGFLARRIKNNIKIGDEVDQSKPYGIIRLGSRVDIVLPNEMKSVLKKGQKVIGGETPLI